MAGDSINGRQLESKMLSTQFSLFFIMCLSDYGLSYKASIHSYYFRQLNLNLSNKRITNRFSPQNIDQQHQTNWVRYTKQYHV